jgi:hypothetical protein
MTVTNKRIYNFYQQNSHLSFEEMNLWLIQVLEMLSGDMTRTMRNTFERQLLDEVCSTREELKQKQREVLEQMKDVVLRGSAESSQKVVDRLKGELLEGTRRLEASSPMMALMQTNHDQMSTKVTELGRASGVLYKELNDFLGKYKMSSNYKGSCSEQELHGVLLSMFPTDEIVRTSSETASGDFVLRRDGAEYVMFENKAYQGNVDKDEVSKFLRDVERKRLNGVLVSQHSGIVGKRDMSVDVLDQGQVLVYLHQVQAHPEKLRSAMDIIDHLSGVIRQISSAADLSQVSLPRGLLDELHREMNEFLDKRRKTVQLCKDQHKLMLAQLETLDLPELGGFMQRHFNVRLKAFCCSVCGAGWDTRVQLAAHQKMHSKRDRDETSTDSGRERPSSSRGSAASALGS